jgi:hypothetical protein
MARTKGLAKKGNEQSSSSSKTPPDLNRTPPSSPHLSSNHSPELSLSPSLSQIHASLPPSPTKSRDSCEEVMNIDPLVMICQEEGEVSTKETSVNKEEEASIEKKRKASCEEEGSDKEDEEVAAQEKEETPEKPSPVKTKPKPKTKKAMSSQSVNRRRSQRLIANIGLRKTQSGEGDKVIHEIPDSDEEEEVIPKVAQPTPVAAPKETKKSKPKKPASDPPKKSPLKSKISKSKEPPIPKKISTKTATNSQGKRERSSHI